MLKQIPVFCLLALLSALASADERVSVEQLLEMLKQQQAQINKLTAELEKTRAAIEANTKADAEAEARVAEVDAKVESTADAVEQVAAGGSLDDELQTTNVPQSPTSVGTAGGRWGPIAGRVTASSGSWAKRTTLGGYGELHYNNITDNSPAPDGADDLDRVDFHRFVLFASHQFNDWLRFASELEIEHSLIEDDGGPGAVALELAWVEMDLNKNHHLRAGIDILPISLINLTHEPNTFYGVERNPIEVEIVPSTWTEATIALWGNLGGGFAYNAYLHSGLVVPTTGSSAFRPRSGRLKVGNADNQDAAILGRLLYTGVPGLEIAVTFDYQFDYTGTADSIDIDALLFETHLDYKHSSGLALRALYARWDIGDDDGAGVDPGAFNADSLMGWYIEPAYRFPVSFVPGEVGIFMRYHRWDERNRISGAHRFEERERFTVGANYWPHPRVVFKVDAQWEDADGLVDRERDGFNLGLGYQF